MQVLLFDTTNIACKTKMAAVEKEVSDDRINGNVHCNTLNIRQENVEINIKTSSNKEPEKEPEISKNSNDDSAPSEENAKIEKVTNSLDNVNGTSTEPNRKTDVSETNGKSYGNPVEETDKLEICDKIIEEPEKGQTRTGDKVDSASESMINISSDFSEIELEKNDEQLDKTKDKNSLGDVDDIVLNESEVVENSSKLEIEKNLLEKEEDINITKEFESVTQLTDAEMAEESKEEPQKDKVEFSFENESPVPERAKIPDGNDNETVAKVFETPANCCERVDEIEAHISETIDNPAEIVDKTEAPVLETTGNSTIEVNKTEGLIPERIESRTEIVNSTEAPVLETPENTVETVDETDKQVLEINENPAKVVDKTELHISETSENPIEEKEKCVLKITASVSNDAIETTDITDSSEVMKDIAMETATTTNNTSEAIEKMDSEDITEIVEDDIMEIVDNNGISKDGITETTESTQSDNSNKNDIPLESNNSKPLIEASIQDIINNDETKTIEIEDKTPTSTIPKESDKTQVKPFKPISKLSNTLDILSDDEDIMLIEDDVNVTKDTKSEAVIPPLEKTLVEENFSTEPIEIKDDPKDIKIDDNNYTIAIDEKVEVVPAPEVKAESPKPEIKEYSLEIKPEAEKELLPKDFLKSYKKNLADMTRDDLEEFCILKIVESVVDKGSLNEIKTKMKMLAQGLEDYKNTAKMLTKQNRDLQVVLKSVQEEQKKKVGTKQVTTPLKITRSVGMQVLLTDKTVKLKAGPPPQPPPPGPGPRQWRAIKPQNNQIPVPKLVPAQSAILPKSQITPPSTPKPSPRTNAITNGVKTYTIKPTPEKRPHSKSDMVDLTDDEPPHKQMTKAPPVPPVRLVNPQTLMAQRQASATGNSPRKVFIPISGSGGTRPQLMLKGPSSGPRIRGPTTVTLRPGPQVRLPRAQPGRHPAPLPETPNRPHQPLWKDPPPPPDLKLSKVENGIVISWKIEGFQESNYEEIASYQLYAYQETSAPPNTSLWKKIGDVKALPLPMACTLTQFMAGYKYYFAVRAVDIKSRCGPFSLPGSILLLHKT